MAENDKKPATQTTENKTPPERPKAQPVRVPEMDTKSVRLRRDHATLPEKPKKK